MLSGGDNVGGCVYSVLMNTNKTFIQDLTVGDTFTADWTRGTEYVVDAVRTVDNMTRVDYHIVSPYASEGVKPYRGTFAKVNLTTVTLKD